MYTSTFGLPPFCVTTFGRLTIFDTSERPKTPLFDFVKRRKKQIGESLKGGGGLPNQLQITKEIAKKKTTHYF